VFLNSGNQALWHDTFELFVQLHFQLTMTLLLVLLAKKAKKFNSKGEEPTSKHAGVHFRADSKKWAAPTELPGKQV
jgi:hypothetical protein